MFGSLSAWFFRHLGGIQIAEDAVGADRIVIRPATGHGLTWAKSSHRSVRGRIESNWSITGEGIEFDIVVPPDTTAEIELPPGRVTESGEPVAPAEGIGVLSSGPNVFRAGAGRYRFLVRP
jgi:alpha-L-rhamnosidase